MRIASAVVLATALGACATSPTDGGGDDDPGPTDDDPGPTDPPIDPPPRGFELKSPTIEIKPLQRITYCWYFQTPNDEVLAVARLRSTSPGALYMVAYTTVGDKQPAGTVSDIGCGVAKIGAAPIPNWMYAAHTPENELQFPADDGTGVPLAMEIAPHQSGFIQVRYRNDTTEPLSAQVTLTADALPAGKAYTRTAPYSTYNPSIAIPSRASNHNQAQTCPVPASRKFWSMTTRTHRQGVHTTVRSGMPASPAMMYESTNWERPNVVRWDMGTGGFASFPDGKLSYDCTWTNGTDRPIDTGDNDTLDEVCTASGYFFPATKPELCYGSSVI